MAMTGTRSLATAIWQNSALHVLSQESTFLTIGIQMIISKNYLIQPLIYQFIFTLCRWIYRRTLVADGNFKADHMKMRRPDGDITLMDGTGFFVEQAPYQRHLQTAVELKQVPLRNIVSYLHG
jgi:hypothetical protein